MVHVLSVAGETLLAFALAGTLFFDVDPAEGRSKVLLGLVLTMAPFAIVAPLVAPMIDRVRGGHRSVIIASMAARAVVASVMVVSIAGESLALFPEAFLMLVLAKTYQVAKAAVVPHVVEGDVALVEANSKLQLLSGITGFAAGTVGAILLQIGAPVVMAAAVVAYGLATVAAVQIRSDAGTSESTLPPAEAAEAERAELRSTAIVTAGTLMAGLRGAVGFVTFLLAFELRGAAERIPLSARAARAIAGVAERVDGYDVVVDGELYVPPMWHFGMILLASVLGGLVGAALGATAAGDGARGAHSPGQRGSAGGLRSAHHGSGRSGGRDGPGGGCCGVGIGGKAGLRCHRATRCTRCRSWAPVRPFRDALSDRLGSRRAHSHRAVHPRSPRLTHRHHVGDHRCS